MGRYSQIPFFCLLLIYGRRFESVQLLHMVKPVLPDRLRVVHPTEYGAVELEAPFSSLVDSSNHEGVPGAWLVTSGIMSPL